MELLGREAECLLIEGLLEDARAGRSSVLRLVGEAGIGKSSLCAYAFEQAGGMQVLRETGVDTESELAFAGLADLLAPVVDRLDAIPGPQAAALAAALALGPPVGGDRFTICAAVLSLLAAAAEEQAVLAVVDDAQWLDGPSAEALLFAARRLDAEGVALLVAVREGFTSTFERADLPELRITGLARGAAGALLRRSVASGIAPEVEERLFETTAGNPLAMLEFAGLLTEAQLAGVEPLGERPAITHSIEQALVKRAAELSEDAQRTLLVAAMSDSGNVEAILSATETLGADRQALSLVESADRSLRYPVDSRLRGGGARSARARSRTSRERTRPPGADRACVSPPRGRRAVCRPVGA